MSSFLLKRCPSLNSESFFILQELCFAKWIPLLAQLPIKKHLSSKFDLFPANYMAFTSPILYQKSSGTPYELFPPNYMPVTYPIPYQKGFVTSNELFMPITCDVLAPFSIKKALLPHRSTSLLIASLYEKNFFIKKIVTTI